MTLRYRYLGTQGINIPVGIGVKHYSAGQIVETEVPIEELGFPLSQFQLIGKDGTEQAIQEQIDNTKQKIAITGKSLKNKTEESKNEQHVLRDMIEVLEKEQKRLEKALEDSKKGGK